MMVWAAVWGRVARAARVKVALTVSQKVARARGWLMAVVVLVMDRATARMGGVMAQVAVMATVEAVRNMAGAIAIALFRVVVAKEDRDMDVAGMMIETTVIALFRVVVAKEARDMDVAGMMIETTVIALFREVVVKDTDQVLIMVEAETATAPARSTVVDTPVVRNINEVDRDTDAGDRTMVRAARVIAAVATSDKVSIITSSTAGYNV